MRMDGVLLLPETRFTEAITALYRILVFHTGSWTHVTNKIRNLIRLGFSAQITARELKEFKRGWNNLGFHRLALGKAQVIDNLPDKVL